MNNSIQETIFSAKAATGTGKVINVDGYRHIVLALSTASSANFTIKFQGSIGSGVNPDENTAPTFSSAQAVGNMWDYIEVYDLQSGTAIDGDTGVSAAGTDDFRLFELNTNGLEYICATITARSAGTVTLVSRKFKD